MPDTNFVHLHSHSHYSLLDGLGKIPDIVGRAKELNMPALALTDHGVLYGAIEFYQEATKQGVKPIIGVEAYVAPGSRKSKTTDDASPYHLILLAQNNTGYQNLLKLVTSAHLEGYYYKPRIDWELLQQHHEGIIATSACLQGEVAQNIIKGDEAKAKETVERYAKLFGDRYYLELQPHPNITEQGTHNDAIRRLAKETGLPTVATNDSHYVLGGDAEPQDVLLCIQTGKMLEDTDRMNMTMDDFSMKTGDQMAQELPEDLDAIANTLKIAERCNLELELGKMIIPAFDPPKQKSPQEYLREQVTEGVKMRYGSKPSKEVLDRVEYEMGVIEKMGYESYFLIVADLVNWAKDQEIMVGPGRGSAAGSIVAYTLNITNLDPLEHGLQFERFLNPDRISMPDIDMDFADDRRGEVIDYIAKKYGSDRVAQIITFGTMAARAAVRDTGRVMGMAYGDVDQVAKLIPFGEPIAKAKVTPELRELAEQSPQVKRLLDLAERLEGVARHASTHAAGVVIGDKPLVNYVPLQKASKGEDTVITQFSMNPIEDVGLLKIDILGLANLTILRNAMEIIEAVTGDSVEIDSIPLDDAKTFELLAKGQTHGVFQLESDGMRRYIKELKPTTFDDIVAMVALYRPGPMQWIDSFIRRKHGREAVSYIDPKVEDALTETYGVIVYQEQVMQISKDLAGFTGGEADTLRKAMGKKIAKLLAEQKEKFIGGAVKHGGMERGLATKLFGQLEDFAQYAFNKAHAAPYALIAYQTAYLKARYPSPFMAALMTSEQENLDKLGAAIAECDQMGIDVLPPDVNESFADFAVTPDKKSIRFGLSAIKNVGRHTVEAVIASRKADGPFKHLSDFLARTSESIDRKSLEALIKAGAFDQLEDRARMLAGLEPMIRFTQAKASESRSGQTSLFGDTPGQGTSFVLPAAVGEVDSRQKLEWERELLGMYVSEHPLDSLAAVVEKFSSIEQMEQLRDGQTTEIACLVSAVKRINTRKGDPMAFVTVEDRKKTSEIIVFPKLYLKEREKLNPGALLKVAGKVSHKDSEIKLLADTLEPLTEESMPTRQRPVPEPGEVDIEDIESVMANEEVSPVSSPDVAEDEMSYDSLTVKLGPNTTLATLEEVKEVLQRHRGESDVYLVIQKGESAKRLKLAHGIRYSKALVDELSSVDWSVAIETA
ncbi:DNA polymerase III subunit alpha [Patescibacteria group bacterium]|nr:DNA polymerase III subunit alpha [Patescibacteria group bacterium]